DIQDQPAEDATPTTSEPDASPFAPPRETPSVEAEPVSEEPTPSPTEHIIEEEANQTAPEVISETKPDESTEVLPKSADIAPKSYDKEDTSQISVFELFGLQKPSETQQMEAVKLDETQETPSPAISITEPPTEKVEKPEEIQ